MIGLPLPDELLLLGYDDATGKPLISTTSLDLGLGGAVLLELALAGRVAVVDRKVVVTDPAPLPDPVVDAALARLRTSGRPRTPQSWVEKLARNLRRQILTRLVEQGVVEHVRHRVLGLFPTSRYPALNPAPETAAHGRLGDVVRNGVTPDERTAALCALVLALDLHKKLFPDLPAKDTKRRLAEVTAGDWAGAAVRRAIEAVQAAVMAAAVSGATAAAVSGSTSG